MCDVNLFLYFSSSLVYRILVESHNSKTRFRVIVVDAGPWREGREMLRRLVSKGIQCTYVLISAASFVMREVSEIDVGKDSDSLLRWSNSDRHMVQLSLIHI